MVSFLIWKPKEFVVNLHWERKFRKVASFFGPFTALQITPPSPVQKKCLYKENVKALTVKKVLVYRRSDLKETGSGAFHLRIAKDLLTVHVFVALVRALC